MLFDKILSHSLLPNCQPYISITFDVRDIFWYYFGEKRIKCKCKCPNFARIETYRVLFHSNFIIIWFHSTLLSSKRSKGISSRVKAQNRGQVHFWPIILLKMWFIPNKFHFRRKYIHWTQKFSIGILHSIRFYWVYLPFVRNDAKNGPKFYTNTQITSQTERTFYHNSPQQKLINEKKMRIELSSMEKSIWMVAIVMAAIGVAWMDFFLCCF